MLEIFSSRGITIDNTEHFTKVLGLVKDRCTLLSDFYDQAHYFYEPPSSYDEESVRPKWDNNKKDFFVQYCQRLDAGEIHDLPANVFETIFKDLATEKNIKMGELQMIFRVILVGSKTGPGVFAIAETIGRDATIERIENALKVFHA